MRSGMVDDDGITSADHLNPQISFFLSSYYFIFSCLYHNKNAGKLSFWQAIRKALIFHTLRFQITFTAQPPRLVNGSIAGKRRAELTIKMEEERNEWRLKNKTRSSSRPPALSPRPVPQNFRVYWAKNSPRKTSPVRQNQSEERLPKCHFFRRDHLSSLWIE